MSNNKLYFGDNLHVLRKYVAKDSIDLIYLDPPFNSNVDYNVLFRTSSARGHRAQIQAFDDTWTWGEEAEQTYNELEEIGGACFALLSTLKQCFGANDLLAYLVMMAIRLIEMHRVLKATGSLYLHCDPNVSCYLRIMLDGIFGPECFQNEISWKRHSAHSAAKKYGPVHDTILFYSKSKDFLWMFPRVEYEQAYLDKYYKYDDGDGRLYWRNSITAAGTREGSSGQPWKGFDPRSQGSHWKFSRENLNALDTDNKIYWPPNGGWPQIKRYKDELKGLALSDFWGDIDKINPASHERTGYPTQKPLELLRRIIKSSSDKGETILDPFCGCGTAVLAAQELGRNWIGIDITHVAIHVIADRLGSKAPGARFDILGQPTDLAGAEQLALMDKYQFQWWATWLCGGQPFGGEKRGRDRGIDGTLEFVSRRGQHDWGIVSVKGGRQLNPSMIRDLAGTVAREKASIGVFICLGEPSKEMEREAVLAGFVELGGTKYRKIQIRTIEQLLAGKAIDCPYLLTTAQEAPAPVQAPKKSKKRAIAPEELQKQRSFLLPIPGGRKDDRQAELPMGEPLLVTPQPQRSRRHKA